MNFKLFNEDILKANLAVSSLIITSYELLQNTVINKIRDLLCVDFEFKDGEAKLIENEEYCKLKNQRHDELNGNKNLYVSSCKWLFDEQCISQADYLDLQEVRLYRNKLAHELPLFIVDDSYSIDISIFEKLQLLIIKIEKWWVINFEIPINPEYDKLQISDEDVSSGIIILMQHLASMVNAEISKLRDLKN